MRSLYVFLLSSPLWVRHLGPWGDLPQRLCLCIHSSARLCHRHMESMRCCFIEDGEAIGWGLNLVLYYNGG